MNTDKNNMDFSKIDVIDMCYFLNGRADLSTNNYLKKISPLLFSKVEMYEYIKFKSDDFDKFKFQLVFDEICEYCFVYMDFYRVVKVNGKFVTKNVVDYEVDYDIKFHNPTEYILKTLELNKGLSVYNQRIVEFIEIAEELYRTVCEQAPGNTLEGTNEQKDYTNLLAALEQYIKNCSATDLNSIINDKKLPSGRSCIQWIGSKADAIRFIEYFNITKKQFNEMFIFQDTKPLHAGNKDKLNTTSDLTSILKNNLLIH